MLDSLESEIASEDDSRVEREEHFGERMEGQDGGYALWRRPGAPRRLRYALWRRPGALRRLRYALWSQRGRRTVAGYEEGFNREVGLRHGSFERRGEDNGSNLRRPRQGKGPNNLEEAAMLRFGGAISGNPQWQRVAPRMLQAAE